MEEEDEKKKQLQMNENDSLSFCLSFNSYSSNGFADIAAKVSEEYNLENRLSSTVLEERNEVEDDDDDDDDFEFSLVRSDPDPTGDGIFYEGQIRPIFPIFDRSLLMRDDPDSESTSDDRPANRLPLRNLFIEERDVPSCSSSEADELDSVPQGAYCVWRPKLSDASPSRCKKSSSTGSASKRWRFRDLLRRCNSDGKDSLVFLTPKNRDQKRDRHEKVENDKEIGVSVQSTGKLKAKGHSDVGDQKASPASAHEAFYVRNRAMKEGNKKKSFLPYRQDLVGFFANVNGLRTFPPF